VRHTTRYSSQYFLAAGSAPHMYISTHSSHFISLYHMLGLWPHELRATNLSLS